MTTALARPPQLPATTAHVAAPVRQRSGSGDALRTLYRDHAAALLAYAQHFTDDRPAAEDAVQETFLRAWRHLPRLLADDRPLRPWLRQVLRRVLIDAARATRAHPVSLLDDTLLDREVDGGYDVLLDRGLLARALHRLSPAHQQVLIEIYYHDAPANRVAVALNIPVGTVRSRLYYALGALRHQLTEPAGAQPTAHPARA